MNLKIFNLNRDAINKYESCFYNNNDLKRIEDIEWQFFQNDNENYVNISYDEEAQRTAAIYATFTSDFLINNEVYKGVQSLDTITDINYRGKGLFIELAKNVYDEAKQNGVMLVYGFPNGNSIHGFVKKLDWKVMDPVPFLLRPLRTKYFTQKIKFLKFLPNFNIPVLPKQHSYTIKNEDFFPEEVYRIWSKFSQNIKICLNRDKKYLDWRYLEKPNTNYEILNCYDGSLYLGFVVFTVLEKHEGKIGYIMELIYDTDKPNVGKALVNEALRQIQKKQADLVLSWSFDSSPNFISFKSNFFKKIPEKLKPIELHFGAASFDDNYKELIEKRDNWYISYSDSDTV